jgi:hypothetical protein
MQGSMLEGYLASFKIDHLNGVRITHWSKEGESGLIIIGDSEMGSMFLERWRNLGFRKSGRTIFKDK